MNQQLPANSVLIEIYSTIVQFPCSSTAYLYTLAMSAKELYKNIISRGNNVASVFRWLVCRFEGLLKKL